MNQSLIKNPHEQPREFHGMLSVSQKMFDFFDQLTKAAITDASVLMRGETGTGKELAARAIHSLSRRSKKSFNAINCATFTSDLMQSELFGHVKGAFTGASSDRKGLFEQSDKGSLFLDEIAEIPLEVQARLLRVLQDRSFMPVGSATVKKVDVRLISATHVSLREAVNEKRFREDLMYRVRVLPLFLPRLAEREGDVEMLAWRFMDEFAGLGYRRITGLEKSARDALLSHSWPGNVRELRNVMEFACALGEGDILRLKDLTPELRGETVAPAPGSYEEIERRSLLKALESSSGNRGKAAASLGISRATLWRKLREYRI